MGTVIHLSDGQEIVTDRQYEEMVDKISASFRYDNGVMEIDGHQLQSGFLIVIDSEGEQRLVNANQVTTVSRQNNQPRQPARFQVAQGRVAKRGW